MTKNYYGAAAVLLDLPGWIEARMDELNSRGTRQVTPIDNIAYDDVERDLGNAVQRVDRTYGAMRPEARKIANMIDRRLHAIMEK